MQGQLSIRGLDAGSLLEKAYSTEYIGIGVQRALVSRLIEKPYAIRGIKYLETAHGAGLNSAMVDYVSSEGERIFPARSLSALSGDIRSLDERWKRLTASLWYSMAYGHAPDRGEELPWSALDVLLLFKKLFERGYVNKSPGLEMFHEISKDGKIDRKTDAELRGQGVRLNYARINHEYWRIMLGEARRDHTRFHAAKLALMADIAEGALDVTKTDLGENDYTTSNPDTRKRWKELFEEGAPPMGILIASAREVASVARDLR